MWKEEGGGGVEGFGVGVTEKGDIHGILSLPSTLNRQEGGISMPVHDWTRVDAGIFHAFHHGWITDIGRALNRGLLPQHYYALPEQIAVASGPTS